MIMAMSMDFPPGFRFYPSDKELLSYYLKPKVNGKTLPCDIITEKQIYGPSANPWDVFDDLSTRWIIWDGLKIVYAFTPLQKIAIAGSSGGGGGGGSKKKENYAKKAGCGTWHGQTSRPIMDDDDRVLGFRRLLSFQINDIDHVDFNQVGHWLMHEYVLCGFEDYALCRITVDMSKNAKVKKLTPPKTCKKTTTAKVSTSCTSTNSGIVDNMGSSGVEEKDNPGFAASTQELTAEELEFLMNDSEDFENFGIEDLSNFGGGYMDVTSFDFESFLGDGSWFDGAKLLVDDDVSNNNNVQTMQNMSCSNALGKRKAFGAQELYSGPSKKLCM